MPHRPTVTVAVTAFAVLIALGCSTAARNVPAPMVAASPAPTAGADPVPAHDTFTVQSRVLGEARPINVYTPSAYRTARAGTRFPVLYMPDGGIVDEDFSHVVNTVDSLIARGVIRPVIVVGIPNTQRRRDLTGPTRVKSDSAIAPRVGGSAAFRQFIRDELLPAVRERYRTTNERSIVGESLAGLFVVETFLEEPSLFTHYVAFDPSLWWNGGALVDSAAARVARFDGAPRTLFIATSREFSTGMGASQIATLLDSVHPASVRSTYVPRPELTHANIFRTVAPQGLADALR